MLDFVNSNTIVVSILNYFDDVLAYILGMGSVLWFGMDLDRITNEQAVDKPIAIVILLAIQINIFSQRQYFLLGVSITTAFLISWRIDRGKDIWWGRGSTEYWDKVRTKASRDVLTHQVGQSYSI
jgi:hypothetical protein